MEVDAIRLAARMTEAKSTLGWIGYVEFSFATVGGRHQNLTGRTGAPMLIKKRAPSNGSARHNTPSSAMEKQKDKTYVPHWARFKTSVQAKVIATHQTSVRSHGG